MNFDFMVEMAWKSALISALALAIAAALRFRPAAERSGVLRAAVALVLFLPLIALALPALPIVTKTVADSGSALPLSLPLQMALVAPDPIAAAPAPAWWENPAPLLEILWLGGAALVLARLVAGLVTLARWTRAGTPVESRDWTEKLACAAEAAGHDGPVRLLASDASAPMSWGWRRPVILVDRDTIRAPGEADAVLAHEFAHIVRRDWLLLILARLMVALFWFNPLMWLLERRLVDLAEEAADARALVHVEPARYAQTLLIFARQAGRMAVPATAIADRGLGRRVRAILSQRPRVGAADPRRVRLAMAACVLLAAPIAALKPVTAMVPAPAPALVPEAASAPVEAPSTTPAPLAPAVARGAPAPRIMAAPAPAAIAQRQLALADTAQPPETRQAPEAPLAPEAPRAGMAPETATPPTPPTPAAAPRTRRAPRAPRADGTMWSREDSERISRDVGAAVAEGMRGTRQALREAEIGRAEVMRAMTPERMAEMHRAIEASHEAMRRGMAANADGMRAREDAMRHAESARAEAMRAMTPERMAQMHRAIEASRVAMRTGMAAGAEGMAAGARSMEQGARQMEIEAGKLRSPAYRQEQIARALRDEHRTLTDAELVAAIPRLEEGARKMHHGAEDLRRGAERMRTRHD
jgi:beta-lactamase regulating signal transducer with metallopeptidase domain